MLAVMVRRMGNSLGIIIPRAYLESLGLHEGAKVALEQEDGSLLLTPTKNKYSLEELVAKMTPENTHPEIQTGFAVGAEFLKDENKKRTKE